MGDCRVELGEHAVEVLAIASAQLANYLRLGIALDYPLLGILVAGVITGSVIGPVLSKYLPDKGLRAILSLVLVVIGLRYTGLF